MRIKDKLINYCSAPLAQCFKQFRLGAVVFFVGLVGVYIASQAVAPSLAQELITLAGLILIGVGFVVAIAAQMRMLGARLLVFWRKR